MSGAALSGFPAATPRFRYSDQESASMLHRHLLQTTASAAKDDRRGVVLALRAIRQRIVSCRYHQDTAALDLALADFRAILGGCMPFFEISDSQIVPRSPGANASAFSCWELPAALDGALKAVEMLFSESRRKNIQEACAEFLRSLSVFGYRFELGTAGAL